MRPPPVGIFSDYKNERLNKMIEDKFSDFDVLCLQEMFNNFTGRREKLKKILLDYGFKYSSNCPNNCFLCNGKVIDCGLLILSKHKILKSKFKPFRKSKDIDLLAEKGILYSKIELPNKIIVNVFNLHLQASYSYVPDEEDLITRKSQLQDLEEFTKSILKDNIKNEIIIINGDFNINSNYDIDFLNDQEKNVLKEEYNLLLNKINIIKNNINEDFEIINLFFEIYKKPIQTMIEYKWNKLDKEYIKSSLFIDKNKKLIENDNSFWSTQTIDYSFIIKPKNLKIDFNDSKIDNYKVTNNKYRQLSDHSALITNFKFKN